MHIGFDSLFVFVPIELQVYSKEALVWKSSFLGVYLEDRSCLKFPAKSDVGRLFHGSAII